MKIYITILSSLMVLFCSAQAKKNIPVNGSDTNRLLWKISGNGLSKPSYLFGSIHLMCKSDIHFSGELKNAIAISDKVYMELDMDDPTMMPSMLTFMKMKEGVKLKDLYPEADYRRLETFFKDSLHTPIVMMQYMKPMLIQALLYPKMLPCKTISGVEEELMNISKSLKKEIKGLETIEFQTGIFDSIPYTDQAKELLKSIDSLDAYKKYFAIMVSTYKNEKLFEIEKLFEESDFDGLQKHQDKLLDNRNKHWVLQLNSIMNHNSVFIAVGAAHLVGKNGMIELLKRNGYKLEPANTKSFDNQ